MADGLSIILQQEGSSSLNVQSNLIFFAETAQRLWNWPASLATHWLHAFGEIHPLQTPVIAHYSLLHQANGP